MNYSLAHNKGFISLESYSKEHYSEANEMPSLIPSVKTDGFLVAYSLKNEVLQYIEEVENFFQDF